MSDYPQKELTLATQKLYEKHIGKLFVVTGSMPGVSEEAITNNGTVLSWPNPGTMWFSTGDLFILCDTFSIVDSYEKLSTLPGRFNISHESKYWSEEMPKPEALPAFAVFRPAPVIVSTTVIIKLLAGADVFYTWQYTNPEKGISMNERIKLLEENDGEQ